MPVVYHCRVCGLLHPAHVPWDTRDEFEAVAFDEEAGFWRCKLLPLSVRQTYYRADLHWQGEYEAAGWDGLLGILAEARRAARRGEPGAEARVAEAEAEVAARRFRVVAVYPHKRVVWAAYRTQLECLAYLREQGVMLGVGHHHDDRRFEAVIEEEGVQQGEFELLQAASERASLNR